MDKTGTAALCKAATNWTLAGDKQLLEVLQNIHQNLVTRCEEVNQRLDTMVTVLDDTSVELQNVNNKFNSLANCQFIENRVYDDDADISVPEPIKAPSKPAEPSPEFPHFKQSVKVLERMHEAIQIIDSESESDEEEAVRSVLMPKDNYSHRPLPYVIGSQAWRRKWHAGLVAEDSDSDNSTKPDDREQYSDSDEWDLPPETSPATDIRDSTTSSDIVSEPDPQPVATKLTPADVAAELARRLQGDPPKIPEVEDPVYPPNKSTKIYRPTQPTPGVIFSDEPPPLDDYHPDDDEEEEDDIFAELHKSKPFQNANTESLVAKDLFSGLREHKSGEGSFDKPKQHATHPNPKQSLFEDESEPELFADKASVDNTTRNTVTTDTDAVKKPIGGISLFGSNKGAESIGAAILKRNQRKSSSDEDSTDERETKAVHDSKPSVRNEERDILSELFAKTQKSEKNKEIVKENKSINKTVREVVKSTSNKSSENKVDLFSDDIFDDIDNIFTTNVSKATTQKNNKAKSIFDDDDDDLFADIAVTATSKPTKKVETTQSSLFDSDDDLFLEKNKNSAPVPKTQSKDYKNESSKSKTANIQHISKNLFDDDSDSDIFSQPSAMVTNDNADNHISSHIVQTSQSNKVTLTETDVTEVTPKSQITSKSLFDDDESDSENIFTPKTKENILQDNDKIITNNFDDIFNDKIDKSKGISTITSLYRTKETDSSDIKIQEKTIIDDKEVSKNNIDRRLVGIKEHDAMFSTKETFQSKTNTENSVEPVDTNYKNSLSPSSDDKIDKERSNIIKQNSNLGFLESISNENVSVFETKQHKSKENNLNTNNPRKDNMNVLRETKIKSEGSYENIFQNESANKNELLFKTDLDQSKLNTNVNHEVGFDKIPKTDIDNSTENDNFISSLSKSVLVTPTDNIFGDILDEPPAFEKSTEFKKSKNINALFDDDSDDETLFFKKNDVILHDNSNFSNDSTNDGIFGMFHDEPPSIDIDFIPKSVRSNNDSGYSPSKSLICGTIDSKPDTVTSSFSESCNNQIIKKNELTDLPASGAVKSNMESSPKEEQPELAQKAESKSNVVEISNNKESPDTLDSPTKKIGKLKGMNININVNTLLPGASPKKNNLEQTDGPTLSTQSQEDLHSMHKKKESVLVKSVSFDGEPDSQILDNKISKERAKIQVKRRPSTRRARKEAVRNSVLDVGEDSTDNSSSSDNVSKSTQSLNRTVPIVKKHVDENIRNETQKSMDDIPTNMQLGNRHQDIEVANKNISEVFTTSAMKDVKSKVVYILNDEDIFDNVIPASETKNYSNVTDVTKTEINEKTNPAKSLFDDLSDSEHELFNNSIKTNTRTNNSASEEDLFGAKKERTAKIDKDVKDNNIKTKTEVKGSLFGDDDDDDDSLFAVKVKSHSDAGTHQYKPTKETASKPAELVFDDPLSLIDTEDD